MSSADVKLLLKTLRFFQSFANVIQKTPNGEPNPFSAEKWNNLKNRLDILDLEIKIDLKTLVDNKQITNDVLDIYQRIMNILDEAPTEELWNCIVDYVHSFVAFESKITPSAAKELRMYLLSEQANKAASVVGAIPNHDEIEKMNELLAKLEERERDE